MVFPLGLLVAFFVPTTTAAQIDIATAAPPLVFAYPTTSEAIALFESGHYDASRLAFEALSLATPARPTPWLGLVRSCLALGDLACAADAAERLAHLDPRLVEVPVTRAIVAFDAHDGRAARAALRRARELAPAPSRIDLAITAVGAGVRPLDVLALDAATARRAAEQIDAIDTQRGRAHGLGAASASLGLPAAVLLFAGFVSWAQSIWRGEESPQTEAIAASAGLGTAAIGLLIPSFVLHTDATSAGRRWARRLQLDARGLVLRW